MRESRVPTAMGHPRCPSSVLELSNRVHWQEGVQTLFGLSGASIKITVYVERERER